MKSTPTREEVDRAFREMTPKDFAYVRARLLELEARDRAWAKRIALIVSASAIILLAISLLCGGGA